MEQQRQIVSKQEALALGLKRYFTGEPCARGHVCDRRVDGSQCVECNRIFDRNRSPRGTGALAIYRARVAAEKASRAAAKAAERQRCQQARDAERERQRKANETARKERQREVQRKWREANKDKSRALQKAWRERNREKRRRGKSARRAAKRGALVRELKALQRGRCAYCRTKLRNDLHVDHVMPLKLNGADNRSNLQLTCGACNLSKNAKHPVDFARERGMLL